MMKTSGGLPEDVAGAGVLAGETVALTAGSFVARGGVVGRAVFGAALPADPPLLAEVEGAIGAVDALVAALVVSSGVGSGGGVGVTEATVGPVAPGPAAAPAPCGALGCRIAKSTKVVAAASRIPSPMTAPRRFGEASSVCSPVSDVSDTA